MYFLKIANKIFNKNKVKFIVIIILNLYSTNIYIFNFRNNIIEEPISYNLVI